MDAVRTLHPPPALAPLSRLPGLPFVPMPRRFSVSLTFSVLLPVYGSPFLSSSRPMMAAIALACFMAQETQRAALSIILRNVTSRRRDPPLVLSSLLPFLFLLLYADRRRPAFCSIRLGFAESRTVRKCPRVRYYLPVSLSR